MRVGEDMRCQKYTYMSSSSLFIISKNVSLILCFLRQMLDCFIFLALGKKEIFSLC